MSKVPQGHRQTVIICIATPHLKLLNINNATPFKLNNLEKVYITPHYSWWTISPSNYKTEYSTPELSKSGQITPSSSFGQWFCYSSTILFFFFTYFL